MDNLAADFEINPNNPLNAEYELGESVGFDCSFELYASGTVWGSINGDINNQTDLINLLNTKVDLTSFEELSQTVTNNYNELTGDIADLTTTVTDNYNTLSGQISDLTGVVNNNYTSLDNRLTTAEGSILDLTDTVNDNYTAINNRVDGIVDSFDGDISDLNDTIDNLSDTVSDNYTDLNDKITDNTDDITTIQNTINSYGDIVSYNAAYFATANQGALADTALQPNDNISELTNDVGYITSASLPTVNNATITIQKNGADVGTFTLNQANNDTLNITVPTQASDIGAMPDTTTIEDLTTTAQLNALNSGATTSNIGQITTNQNNIADIRSLIPLQASTSNQLADKGFINSSIATNTANFIGTFNSVAELEAYSGTLTNNDYAFVATTDSAGNTLYDRYKYNADTQEWLFEYELNNSSFTAQQWASINSGITSGDVTLIGTALQPNDNISELINDAGYITSASLPTVNNGTLDIQVNGTSIGTFTANQSGNTTANIVVPDSATWGNISGTLSNQTDLQTALNAKQNTISDLSTIRSGASLGATALQPNDNITELVNNAGYITGITSSDVTNALGYTPYNASNPDGYITSADLSNYVTNSSLATTLTDYQPLLVSGANIKTINNNSILGSGNLTLDGLPSQTGQAGKFLTTNGTTASWATVSIPTVDQTYDATSANAQSGVAINGELASNYQPKLVSGTNIKTINNTSLLGSGNIDTSEIFVAEYNRTSYYDVEDALRFGKIIICRITVSGHSMRIPLTSFETGIFVFSMIEDTIEHRCVLRGGSHQYSWDYSLAQLSDTTLSNVSSIDSNSAVQTALDAKVDLDYSNADYQPVNKSGDTMTGNLIIQTSSGGSQVQLRHVNFTKGTNPSSNMYWEYKAEDNNTNPANWYTNRVSNLVTTMSPNGTVDIAMVAYKNDPNSNASASIKATITSAGVASCTFPNTTCCDGQYVNTNTTIASNVSVNGSSNLTYTLNLPSDGRNYMVWIMVEANTGSASGDYVNVKVGSEIMSTTTLARATTKTASSISAGSTACIVVSSSHKIYLNRASNWKGTVNLFMIGYRRIGTNA
jgi:hypothetical protein